MRDASKVYTDATFTLDTSPESLGGEQAIREGLADLAGFAGMPSHDTLETGVQATLIGKDAIAVVVHPQNSVENLTAEQLRAIFTGKIRSWKELGGGDVEIHPFIVGTRSATRKVFRAAVLGEDDYSGCEVVEPDADIPARVAADTGGIGQISFSFLAGNGEHAVRAVAIDGKAPSPDDFDYPITRPLHLLWRPGDAAIEAFVQWAQSEEGQEVVMRRFVGARIVAEVGPQPDAAPPTTGTLVVYTKTFPVFDGQMYYYPHSSYAILSRDGKLVERVRNHRGQNDERPTRVALAPGTYLVRPDEPSGNGAEFLVTIQSGRITEVDVEKLLKSRRP